MANDTELHWEIDISDDPDVLAAYVCYVPDVGTFTYVPYGRFLTLEAWDKFVPIHVEPWQTKDMAVQAYLERRSHAYDVVD